MGVAVMMSLSSAMIAGLALYSLGILDGSESPLDTDLPPVVFLLSVVVISPFVETLLMFLLLKLLQFVRNETLVSLLSALVWAGLHSLAEPAWGLVIFGPFVVFSAAFLRWQRTSTREAIKVVFGIHAIHNLFPSLLFLLGT